MTTSRYVNHDIWEYEVYIDNINWQHFRTDIRRGCTFIFNQDFRQIQQKRNFPLRLNVRYYLDTDNNIHYHISNDERRRLIKYIR